MSIKNPIWREIGLPAFILCAGTLLFRLTELDITLQQPFFVPGTGWVSKDAAPWRLLYDYGTWPAILMAVAGLLAYIASFWTRRVAAYRIAALYLVLVMVIGPGLIINAILKDHWGRPRPRNIAQFEGERAYLRVWQKGTDKSGNSFPSGHASMGFFLMAPFFLFRERARRLAVAFLTLGISFGLLMGLGRMVQGGHFASDVLWSGGFVYFTALAAWRALDRPHMPVLPSPNLRRSVFGLFPPQQLSRIGGFVITCLALVVLILAASVAVFGLLCYWGAQRIAHAVQHAAHR